MPLPRDASFPLPALALFAALLLAVWPASAQPLVPESSIELPAVGGRIDHLAIDLQANRLFIAALGADSLEVVDLAADRRLARIRSLHEPQGVAYAASGQRLFVANGSAGNVQAFAAAGPPAVATADDLDDADNLRLDAQAGRLYVGYGHALAVLEAGTLRRVQRIELSGHPEAFELERQGGRIFVNVPGAGHIAVVDRASGKVTATWPVAGARGNFAMALDEPGRRLFVATRQPAQLLAYDTASGRRVAALPVCGDADDLFFDGSRRQLYAVCGEGVVDVVRQIDPDHYEIAQRLPTAAGARTGLFVPERSQLFVAVPSRGPVPAQIRAFKVR
ncbi:YncE family protein [Caenimonas terrae]|uniref:YncE family protein n=1 Tax=Caenimonas terrae TaxID=696074 RepID=A0ABW0NIZ3_9BURK